MDGSEKRRLLLNSLMDQKQINAAELSRRTGIKESTISQYRSGTKKLNGVVTLERLAAGLDEHESIFFPKGATAETNHAAIMDIKDEISNIKNLLGLTVQEPPPMPEPPFPKAAAHKKSLKN